MSGFSGWGVRAARQSIALAVLALCYPGLAVAQGRGDPTVRQERMEKAIDDVVQELELSDEEAEVTRSILADGAQRRLELMREMRASGARPDPDAMRARMLEIEEATDEMLAAFLSDEKMKRYREIREKHREEARARGGGRRGPGGP